MNFFTNWSSLGLSGERVNSMWKIILMACLVILTACVQKPIVDYDQSRDFMALHNYAWVETPPPATDAIVNNTLNSQRVHQAVDDVLAGRNMQKVDKAKADFLVTYRMVKKDKINSSSTGMGFGLFGSTGGIGMGGTVDVTQYEETELFIDMLDPKTSALIWRGSVKYSAQDSLTPDARASEIRKKVNFILSAYPPR
jgi:hypothetical protein